MIDEVLNPVVVAINASIVIVGLLDGLSAVGDGLLVTSFSAKRQGRVTATPLQTVVDPMHSNHTFPTAYRP